jgi:hypothetical protein
VERPGRHRHAILAALAISDGDLIHREIHVPDAPSCAFHEPQPVPYNRLNINPTVPSVPASTAWTRAYVSEFALFMNRYLEQHPEVVEDQRRGRDCG